MATIATVPFVVEYRKPVGERDCVLEALTDAMYEFECIVMGCESPGAVERMLGRIERLRRMVKSRTVSALAYRTEACVEIGS